jgi:D-serine deaminase-like pyridoxal phosphate-dependent protein
VSTLREAEYFFDHGFREILYAVGMVPAKVPRAAALVRRGAKLSTIVDSVDAALGLVDASANAGVYIPALIEIDSDGHRAGSGPATQGCSTSPGAGSEAARRHDPRRRFVQLQGGGRDTRGRRA